jgi:hypothetical protein
MLSFRNNMQIDRMQVNRVYLAFIGDVPNAFAIVDAENTEMGLFFTCNFYHRDAL